MVEKKILPLFNIQSRGIHTVHKQTNNICGIKFQEGGQLGKTSKKASWLGGDNDIKVE